MYWTGKSDAFGWLPHIKVPCGINIFGSDKFKSWFYATIYPLQSIYFLKGLFMRNLKSIEKSPSQQGSRREGWTSENSHWLFSNGAHTHKNHRKIIKPCIREVKTDVEGSVSHFFKFLFHSDSTDFYFWNSWFYLSKSDFPTSSLHYSKTEAKLKNLWYASLGEDVEKAPSEFHRNP